MVRKKKDAATRRTASIKYNISVELYFILLFSLQY